MQKKQKYIYILSAALGPPAIFGAFAEGIYKYALSIGKLPYLIMPDWVWYSAYVLSLAVGVLALSCLPFQSKFRKNIATALYILFMTGVLLAINLTVACTNGDCL